MTIPTCAVTAIVQSGGAMAAGARVSARLSRYEVHEGYVVPALVRGVTGADGRCTLNLWPNALGSTESWYDVTIEPPAGPALTTRAIVPFTAAALLHEIAALPAYPGKPDGQLAADAAAVSAAAAHDERVLAEMACAGAEQAEGNAAQHKQAAQEAATASGESATAAATSAGQAAASAGASAGSALDAQGYADQAQASAESLGEIVSLHGAVGNGVADDTAQLIACFARGGDWYVPEGRYRIANAGVDAGGVYVTITKSLRVRCHPNAVFVADNLDNDLLRFSVPSNGAGLPADGIDVEWLGGVIDQRNQKGSTTMPSTDVYPHGNVGASPTCDGISIRGEYISGGVTKLGINRVRVAGAMFLAGEHWQASGGDSGLFISGAGQQEVFFNVFRGNRDCGFYGSADNEAATTDGNLLCDYNTFSGCFHGVAVKRSAEGFSISRNRLVNCVRAITIERLLGSGNRAGLVEGNTARSCGTFARVQYASNVTLRDNVSYDAGHVLANGSIEPLLGCRGIQVLGASSCVFENNHFIGVSAAAQAAYPSARTMLETASFDPGAGAVLASRNKFIRNHGSGGWRNLAVDTGDRNDWIDNEAPDATVSSLVANGTNAYETRVDTATGVRIHLQPLLLADGSASAPTLVRRGQVNTGIFFAANKVGVAAAGVERIAANNAGVAFNGSPPIAKPSITGSRGGNAALAALLTQLAAYGLITDSTTA